VLSSSSTPVVRRHRDTSAQSDDKSSLLAGCLPPIRHLRDKGDRGQFAGQWIEDKLYPANVAAIYLL
jgi:hypothetical protein